MSGVELLPRFEAWAQEEIGAQQALGAALEGHARVLARGRPQEVEASLAELDAADPRGSERRAELDRLLGEFARRAGVAVETLTLGSVAERFGQRGARLTRLRAELRDITTVVRDRSRTMTLVARQQRALVVQVLEAVLGREALEGNRGAVVDGRA